MSKQKARNFHSTWGPMVCLELEKHALCKVSMQKMTWKNSSTTGSCLCSAAEVLRTKISNKPYVLCFSARRSCSVTGNEENGRQQCHRRSDCKSFSLVQKQKMSLSCWWPLEQDCNWFQCIDLFDSWTRREWWLINDKHRDWWLIGGKCRNEICNRSKVDWWQIAVVWFNNYVGLSELS